jgi:hypothetical protein
VGQSRFREEELEGAEEVGCVLWDVGVRDDDVARSFIFLSFLIQILLYNFVNFHLGESFIKIFR